MTSNGRLPKKAKFKYLSNQWSDLSQTLIGKITLYGQEMGMYSQWILTPKSKW